MGRLLEHHEALLERWRHAMNLVGPGPLRLHYQDCAAALDLLEPEGRWVDLGSGAGFPGIVFADRFPEVPLDLVESRTKRCAFLEEVVAEAEGPVRVRCVRVETLEDASYDGVLARAFAPPERLVEMAARLLRPGGRLLLMLQEDADVPSSPVFHVEHARRYEVEGKARRAVLLRKGRAPRGDPGGTE